MTKISCYTTKIKASQTIGEIQALLADFGAEQIGLKYENKYPISVHFVISHNGINLPITLKANVQGMLKALGKKNPSATEFENARNVAWRNILNWIEAQLSLLAADQTSASQLFFGFISDKAGDYRHGQLLLEMAK